jgi:hypothetical protein
MSLASGILEERTQKIESAVVDKAINSKNDLLLEVSSNV